DNALRHAILTGNCTQKCGKIPAMRSPVYSGVRVHGVVPSNGPWGKAACLETAALAEATRYHALCRSSREHKGTYHHKPNRGYAYLQKCSLRAFPLHTILLFFWNFRATLFCLMTFDCFLSLT